MEFECTKCGSSQIIPNVRITDQKEGQFFTAGDLTSTVYTHPDALIFKGAARCDLRAAICGDCGYVELYAMSPASLYEAYQQALRESPPQSQDA
jgi:predicted nucleic-acid-binding Zn-ribbon protein